MLAFPLGHLAASRISFTTETNCGLISGDGRWRQVIRRCASVADTGVTGVCNWGVYDNGIYWEECYCSEDGCNGSSSLHTCLLVIMGSLVFIAFFHKWQS